MNEAQFFAVPEDLICKNPNLQILPLTDPVFQSYGRVIRDFDASSLIAAAKEIPMPESGSSYRAGMEEFESLPEAALLRDRFYGTLPTQVGFCWGKSSYLNGTEWHSSNEINIAATPLVLLLAHVWEMKNNVIDSSRFRAFYVPEGTTLEVYSSTLHFCPCQTEKEGFRCLVALPADTNTDLAAPAGDALLFRRNKWIVAHCENEGLCARGVVPGITGENLKISWEESK